MGANVSRHNSKGGSGGGDGGTGLSAGRRSQSSGSIYSRQRRGSRATVDRGDAGSEKGGCSRSLQGGYFDLTAGIDNEDHNGEDQDRDDGDDGSSLDEDNTPQASSRIPPLGDASGGGVPLHWKFSDGPVPPPGAPCAVRINNGAGHHHHHHQVLFCDQGYGSERSPEEEYPPPLLGSGGALDGSGEAVYHQLELHSCYPFITPDSTFSVSLAKGSRGLGLSVTGGIDSGGSWPGLIRVKRLFPHQPAAACGCLSVGDLILEANAVPLTGLTNYEALEVLRTAPAQVELRICRPPPDVLNCVSPISEVPPPPPTRREQPPSSLNLSGGITSDDDYHGEFEITMRKMQGSLGFTLRKEDDSALGHYIRALVREPALKDGRIRPGDKIIAVNDKEISEMSHEEAVQFLRQCGDLVKLRLYRDAAQTPIATLSPTETTPRTSFCRKAQLRQEAVDMLNDIAVRKLLPNQSVPLNDSHRSTGGSPTASPRRIRRALTSDSSSTNSVKTYATLAEEQFHEALLHDGVYHSGHIPLDEDSFNSLFIQDDDDDPDRPNRPASLDLYNPNQTPVAARKPKFNFSLAHNAYELNNLDAEILDAPNLTYNMNEDLHNAEIESTDGYPHEPASMPHIPTESTFSYKNPAYQSAHPSCTMSGPAAVHVPNENGQAVAPVDGGGRTVPSRGGGRSSSAGDTRRERGERDAMVAPIVSGEDSEVESGTIRRRRKPILKESKPLVEEEPKILAIELNRGWNSRLGFSLQGAAGVTYVSAVHADSVAARDGRIKPGDRVIKVNDENVDHLSTNEIIDLLRIVRGPVCIVVSRGKAAAPGVGPSAAAVTQDCLKSNAVN